MQLIQYAPTTEQVHQRPLMIIPPWINKFYILDLQPKNSFIKFCVDQGFTVFVLSWVNPDETARHKSFEDYMLEGPLAALDAIEQATGEREVTAIGYCLGGTLLASTLAWMKRAGRRPDQGRDLLHHPGRLHRAGRARRVHRRGAAGGAREAAWPSAAISTAPRWPRPSTCCAPTT